MCAFVCVCVCLELGLCRACDQTAGWCPLQRRGVFVDGSNTAHGPGFKRPPIIALTYSKQRMSLNVDHTIHQLWWAQGPSNTRTTAPQVVRCLLFWLKPPLQSSKPICCRRCGVRPLTPKSCQTRQNSGVAFSFMPCYLPKTHTPVYLTSRNLLKLHNSSFLSLVH